MNEEERAIYRAALEQHLAKSGHRDPDVQQMWVDVIETTLTDFMQRHYMGGISSIYGRRARPGGPIRRCSR